MIYKPADPAYRAYGYNQNPDWVNDKQLKNRQRKKRRAEKRIIEEMKIKECMNI